ncbi:hypothetical protein CTEN210_10487 [Chaetoceros tenuissimus]|uniref:Ubiquitin-like protease family profile domain-containing protein n=1 Tax=Chaetoceros tenuissimus TaxID=426638 RepID=A0AAD3CXJ5_9STRA|nr:hypothetical protein CTEN210_10487 [Chaetoceros tenuissimus]
MNRKRTKIDNERVLSDLSRNLNEEQLHLQKNVKPHNKLRGTYGEFKDFFQKCEEEKRELATNQLQVMNLEENEAVYHIHPEEQHDVLDHTLESKKVQLKEVLANVDSKQDELTALKEEYEMMKIECANQITRARDMKLDAERKLKNLEMRVCDKKSDLESLIESEKIENERIEKIYRERGRVSASLGDDYVLLFHIGLTSDPTRPKEEQIEESLIPLRTRCREILHDAKADFEQRCKKDRTTQEELAIEMEEVDQKTSQERHEPLSLASLFEPITGDLRLKVDNALFTYGDMNEILAVSGSDIVVRESFRSLSRGALDDKVVNFFFKSLAIRDIEKQRNHFVESTFLSELLGVNSIQKRYSYRNVRSLSESVLGGDVFLLDKVFFPCKVDEKRWACAVVYMKEKKIQYFDSVKGDGSKYVDVLFQYLQDEWKAKKEGEFPDLARWDFIHRYRVDGDWKGDKEQDSGVFACIFADCLSVDIQFSAVFVESKMKESRKYIAASILKNSESLEGYSDRTLPEWWPEDQPKKLYHELRLVYWDEEIKLMFQKTFD